MNLSFLKKNQYILPISVALVAIGVLVLLFVALPFRDTIVSENAAIQQFNAKAESDQRRISSLREYRNQSAMVASDSPKLSLLLPEDKVVDFIRETEAIVKTTGGAVVIGKGNNLDDARKASSGATKTGNQIKGADLLNGLPDGKTIGFTLTFTGTYVEAADYLHKIETSPYYLSVLSIDIRPTTPSQGVPGRLNMFSVPVVGSTLTSSSAPTSISTSALISTPANIVDAVFSLIVYLQ